MCLLTGYGLGSLICWIGLPERVRGLFSHTLYLPVYPTAEPGVRPPVARTERAKARQHIGQRKPNRGGADWSFCFQKLSVIH